MEPLPSHCLSALRSSPSRGSLPSLRAARTERERHGTVSERNEWQRPYRTKGRRKWWKWALIPLSFGALFHPHFATLSGYDEMSETRRRRTTTVTRGSFSSSITLGSDRSLLPWLVVTSPLQRVTRRTSDTSERHGNRGWAPSHAGRGDQPDEPFPRHILTSLGCVLVKRMKWA